ncbi:amino acid ABC transporter permease [Oscillatoria sp. FACHB-1407]|uniref:amino acid ABC transporter permease n=1 Tax=Oscillatoria sp. FACHB-1407 TaxID=2692847 RepID=UPI001684F70A|nr:amino acid ABC transporter permease [Oscillatoria sp. FACHB-1407]MBD2463279.1 amino acid ABC transporter permease [Oscillatoria sp. FACHB-1407]
MTSITPQSTSGAPPIAQVGPVAWLQKNLFSSWSNSLLTIVVVGVFLWLISGFLNWATTKAQWAVIPANLPLYMVGLYPADQYWRIWVVLSIITTLAGLSWGIIARNLARLFTVPILVGIAIAGLIAVLMPVPVVPYRLLLLLQVALVVGAAWTGRFVGGKFPAAGRYMSFAWIASFPVVLWLIGGGLGLKAVSTNNWGGLLLTLIMAIVSIVLCFPIGVALALGRRSDLPVVRWLSTLYIELIRGVPLISILFMGQVMIPMFLPEGVRPDRVLRAILGLTIFSAAYLAENVRGGLQAIPRGQSEAARALGFNPVLTTGLIVLPQALKISIPAIVGQFIGLFQDTTLLSIVGLVELLGISRSILANPQFLGRYAEVFLFIGVFYWFFCYIMSSISRQIERRLNTEHR